MPGATDIELEQSSSKAIESPSFTAKLKSPHVASLPSSVVRSLVTMSVAGRRVLVMVQTMSLPSVTSTVQLAPSASVAATAAFWLAVFTQLTEGL